MSDTLEYTPDLYTLVDEDGKEQTFEMLDAMEHDGQQYFALVPYFAEPEEVMESDGDLVILKSQKEGEEEILVSIDDDDEFEKIGQIFLERIQEMWDEDDCDCEGEECDCGDDCDCH